MIVGVHVWAVIIMFEESFLLGPSSHSAFCSLDPKTELLITLRLSSDYPSSRPGSRPNIRVGPLSLQLGLSQISHIKLLMFDISKVLLDLLRVSRLNHKNFLLLVQNLTKLLAWIFRYHLHMVQKKIFIKKRKYLDL